MQQQPMKYFVLVKESPIQIQKNNANAAAAVATLVKTCLGPRAMQKMILTKIGSIEVTNDGNAILRELDVSNPAAKIIIELARTQDDEVGDGTTSVIILTSEILGQMIPILENNVHPVVVSNFLSKLLIFCQNHLKKISYDVENKNEEKLKIIRSSINTKICSMFGVKIEELALKAVQIVGIEEMGMKRCDIKKYVRIEKIAGGDFSECRVVDGLILNKNIVHSQMRRRIENPRIIILDFPLEYKKGESQTNFEFRNEEDFTRALEIEEEQVKIVVENILKFKPDIVVTEKGICDYALSILYSNNVTALRRLKKTESERLSSISGASIISSSDDIQEKHVGIDCGLFEYEKIGDEYYCNFLESRKQKACSVILRGSSKDILNELERNFNDAIKVAKNIFFSPKLVTGAGSTEISLAKLLESSNFYLNGTETEKKITLGLAEAFRNIPAILAANSGVHSPLSVVSKLEKKHDENHYYGIDGITGDVVDMRGKIVEPLVVKLQYIKSAIETAILLMRVDGIIYSSKAQQLE
ncbi:subunit gamma of T-complex protein 1 [Hamiltosporidium tvaerminnensis]|uniref:T-complex protein 1 subunit gamma n=2 Tax=Hamiltosporidium TaxID=1176354 RepID=A0A4Q9L8V2_9MICR|nr:T-complex protein 1 subunit gamma [Hamiltosporidium tvaerminnensis]TBT99598.1 subunit gamma of T-complex protein 1 [Hamiltosporidium magnivora]TBU04034.1 subunit gamma of T-complex protein 1 [Hamiltosporidium magnivora]TBU04499.1 subunit gamma of T-complex protein 1 [Hamiltosporidium tvaerminnensis]TBU17003.1 subunit gamma of T-complex protein 1 [Hamiltosporidium tvaerminnensis]